MPISEASFRVSGMGPRGRHLNIVCLITGEWCWRNYKSFLTQCGETRHSNYINAQHVQFLEQRGDSGSQEPAPEQEEYQEAGADHDDLAF